MPRKRGWEWDHVKIIELKDKSHQYKVECKYCKHVIVAGTSCVREHFLHIYPDCGVDQGAQRMKQSCSLP